LIHRFQSLNSTNDKLKEMLENIHDGDVILANTQTAGKGRANKTWIDSPGKSLLFSVFLDAQSHQITPENLPLIPIIVSVIVADAIEKKFSISLETKWPNDLLFQNQKVCGILCESMIEGNLVRAAIVGIGINFDQTKNDFPKEIQKQATSLKLISENKYPKEEILMAIVKRLKTLRISGVFLDLWKKRCPFLGKEISFHSGDILVSGKFVDLNDKGALILETKDGLQTFYSGEIV